MNATEFERVFARAAEEMTRRTQELCALDRSIGDGDHGVTIERGFSAALNAAEGEREPDIGAALGRAAKAMSQAMGGAIGPIYGALFTGMSRALADDGAPDELTAALFARALSEGVARVQRVAAVKEGEKTVFDAMAPAARACAQVAERGASVAEAFEAAARAAENGAQDTIPMRALKGRAKFIGEKSIGHKDAGATSFAMWMRALSDAAKEDNGEKT